MVSNERVTAEVKSKNKRQKRVWDKTLRLTDEKQKRH